MVEVGALITIIPNDQCRTHVSCPIILGFDKFLFVCAHMSVGVCVCVQWCISTRELEAVTVAWPLWDPHASGPADKKDIAVLAG